MKGFLSFIREQGVVGLAVGFILGTAISKVVSSLVADIINPLLGVVLGFADNMTDLSLTIGPIQLAYGHFMAVLIDFIIIALVVYFGVRILKLDKLDKKKDK